VDLTDIIRIILYPIAAEYTLLLPAHGNFSKIDYILGYKASPKKHKKIKIISCVLSKQS
jgi:hypothetical protein